VVKMMMRGATEVRNGHAELEEQRREVSYLRSELQAMSKRKGRTFSALRCTKAAAKKGWKHVELQRSQICVRVPRSPIAGIVRIC